MLKQYFGFSRHSFGYIGKNVILTPPIFFSNKKNVFLYDNTQICGNSVISSTNANFILKANCCIAEGLTVMTGNHAMIVGKKCVDISNAEKPIGLDNDVVVESDVWIGCNVTLLSGVHIGRGAVIAAGAVVSRNVLPYSVCGGVPAKFIKFKWNKEEILRHEQLIYNTEERMTVQEISDMFSSFSKL